MNLKDYLARKCSIKNYSSNRALLSAVTNSKPASKNCINTLLKGFDQFQYEKNRNCDYSYRQ